MVRGGRLGVWMVQYAATRLAAMRLTLADASAGRSPIRGPDRSERAHRLADLSCKRPACLTEQHEEERDPADGRQHAHGDFLAVDQGARGEVRQHEEDGAA